MAKRRNYGGFGVGDGSATQKMAIESIKNIANADVVNPGAAGKGRPDPDVEAIARFLESESAPVPIKEVALKLGWDSERAAEALSRGGALGRLTFMTSGNQTFVGISATLTP